MTLIDVYMQIFPCFGILDCRFVETKCDELYSPIAYHMTNFALSWVILCYLNVREIMGDLVLCLSSQGLMA